MNEENKTNEKRISIYGEPFVFHDKTTLWDVFSDCFIEVDSAGQNTKKYELALTKRIASLLNLFAGVSDATLEQLTNGRTPEQALAIAVLLNPLESVPLCMLIDAVQDTPEYQKQTACYRTWKEFYDLVNNVATRLREREMLQKRGETSRRPLQHDIVSITNELFRFIAPLIRSNPLTEG